MNRVDDIKTGVTVVLSILTVYVAWSIYKSLKPE